MGQTLSAPVTEKSTASGEDDRLAWGVSEMQGWRLSMEDAHAHVLSLGPDPACNRTSYFAVYDGHGGSTVAKFAGDTVHQRLAANEEFKKKDWEGSLKRAFLGTDEDLRATPDFKGDPSGCTAVAALITHDMRIFCANAGDSRSVLSLGGEAKPMSYDHKPTNNSENSRIVAAGGYVEFGRVNGNLALSRALGDFEFKQNGHLDAEHQIVTADPDIVIHDATSNDEFLILACDGIWDVLTSQQVIDWVRRGIADRKKLPALCEALMDRCLAPDSDWGGVGCDNMTVMIVALKGKRTLDEWYDWVASNVASGKTYQTPKEFDDPFSSGPRGVASSTAVAAAGSSGGLSSPAGAKNNLSASLSNVLGNYAALHDPGKEDDDDEFDLPGIQAALRAEGHKADEDGDLKLERQDEEEDDDAQMHGSQKPALVVNGMGSVSKTNGEPPSPSRIAT